MDQLHSILDIALSRENVVVWVRSLTLLVIGLPVVLLSGKFVQTLLSKHYSRQYGMVAGKIITYGGSLLIVISLFYEFGFSLTPLLGAAGILGVALGFASQTSVSNVISGLFLIAEKQFEVGDVLQVDQTRGEVLSVDLLSVKLRTFDNRLVRIPNEVIIKTEITNLTKFPIRRIDIQVSVAYKEDIGRVKEVLKQISADNPDCLQEPEPAVYLTEFANSSINLLFAVWTLTSERLRVKSMLQEEIKARFDALGIEIPFPHLSLYRGSASEPFKVEITSKHGVK